MAFSSSHADQHKCDTQRCPGHENDVAQRDQFGSTLARSAAPEETRSHRDQEEVVTTALSIDEDTDAGPDWSAGRALPAGLDEWLAACEPGLIQLRRHLHAHPELSGREFETAALVARELTHAG